MSRVRSTGGRPQAYAYFISVPLALLSVALLVPLNASAPAQLGDLPVFLLFLVLFVLAQATVLHFEVRRHSFMLTITEIPLLIALLYVSPLLVVVARVLALIIVQGWQRFALVRMFYNVAAVALATTVAGVIVQAKRPEQFGPLTWVVLAVAVCAATAITLGGVIAVVTLV